MAKNTDSKEILFSWLGNRDIDAMQEQNTANPGAVVTAIREGQFTEAHILVQGPPRKSAPKTGPARKKDNLPGDHFEAWRRWAQKQVGPSVQLQTHRTKLPPAKVTDHAAIYRQVMATIEKSLAGRPDARPVFHLSSGTPSMHAVWMLVGKTRQPEARLVQTSDIGTPFSDAKIPFSLSAEYTPRLDREQSEGISRLTLGQTPQHPSFQSIIGESAAIREACQLAARYADTDLPILIQGESGTGKELFAKAIHEASPRNHAKLVTIHCGAIPAELIEAELFGYKKGAFTGADKYKPGLFKEANNGTVFLDEIGECSPATQTKLLRVLQEGEIRPVGATTPTKVDVRILAATNRNLAESAGRGEFREDLYWRLSAGILDLPAIRERSGDIRLLINYQLAETNKTLIHGKSIQAKKISAGARKILESHEWSGNFREIQNVLARAWVLSDNDIGTAAVNRALGGAPKPSGTSSSNSVLDREFSKSFCIHDVIGEVSRHYLSRALRDAGNNRTKAARILGFNNPETLKNWINKYGVKESLV